MHLLIAFITALASLLYALERLGIDVGWVNPWAWRRKRKWLKQYHASPALSIEQPLEAAAILLIATAKIDGDLSTEEKTALLNIFEHEFKLSYKQASDLFVASAYLLNSGREVYERPKDVLSPSLEHFSAAQKDSVLELLHKIAELGGGASEVQRDYISQITSAMKPQQKESW